jgi:hypothetical protein
MRISGREKQLTELAGNEKTGIKTINFRADGKKNKRPG